MDPYKVLGLNRNATDQEIKQKHRKLVVEHHPDKNVNNQTEAKQKTEEINAARDILLDPRTRAIYNQHGWKGLQEDRGSTHQEHRKLPVLDYRMQVDLDAFYSGKLIQFTIPMRQSCQTCGGHGCTDLSKKTSCTVCNGHGKVNVQQNMGFFVQTHVADCRNCNGQGSSFDRKFSCKPCNAAGWVTKMTSIEHYIKKGEDYGQFLLEHKGEYVDANTRGHIRLLLEPPAVSLYKFTRRGSSLSLQVRLSLREALLGFEKTITHIPIDRKIVLTSTQVIQPGSIFKLPGWGMPKKNGVDQNGFLNIKFVVDFPTKIDSHLLKILQDGLPCEEKQAIDSDDDQVALTNDMCVDEEELDEPENIQNQEHAAPRVHMMNNGGVQCAQQ